jgi:hypothetical protein
MFPIEVMVRPRRGGQQRILGAVAEPHAVRRLLTALPNGEGRLAF